MEYFDKIRVGLNEGHITGFIEWINTNMKKYKSKHLDQLLAGLREDRQNDLHRMG